MAAAELGGSEFDVEEDIPLGFVENGLQLVGVGEHPGREGGGRVDAQVEAAVL